MDLDHTRPADIHIAGWDRDKPAAFDITITSPLCPAIFLHFNGPKYQELGWSCIPLAVETYGNWGKDTISYIHLSSSKSTAVAGIYG